VEEAVGESGWPGRLVGIDDEGRPISRSSSMASDCLYLLYYDEYPPNTRIFTLSQQLVEIPARVESGEEGELVIFALGDSLASPHFFSGSGLSTGRMAAELTSQMISDSVNGKFDRAHLQKKLEKLLKKIAGFAISEGSAFADKLSPIKEVNEIAYPS